MKLLNVLNGMEYPGRLIVIGCLKETKETLVLYAITGRSSSSQARKLVVEPDSSIVVQPTNMEVLKKGNPDLLVYPAITVDNKSIAVSNGQQTRDIHLLLGRMVNPVEILDNGLYNWQYEPDEPNYTPRINGCVTSKGAALSIIKRAENEEAERQIFQFPLIPGKAKMIATYTGKNVNPLPSFHGEPVCVDLPEGGIYDIVYSTYRAMKPAKGSDFRVSVAGMIIKGSEVKTSIQNRHK
jgi:IMP cyclohydrolase